MALRAVPRATPNSCWSCDSLGTGRSPGALILDAEKAAYEQFGVEFCWVVVPDLDKPEVIVFELHDGRYQEAAHVTGEETFAADRPFRIEVVPSGSSRGFGGDLRRHRAPLVTRRRWVSA